VLQHGKIEFKRKAKQQNFQQSNFNSMPIVTSKLPENAGPAEEGLSKVINRMA